jgi:CHAT domain-containing protein
MPAHFVLDWFGGSSAVVDLQTEESNGSSRYLLRYTSPFRPTMRAPRQELPAGQQDLDQIDTELDDFASRLGGALRSGEGPPPAPTLQEASELSELGQQIFEFVLPPVVRSDLRKRDLFVELGTDEGLLHFPWELMHDGDEFVCLKHFVGRYVNLRRTPEVNGRPLPEPGSDLGEMRVLLVGVSSPRPHGDRRFDSLPAVDREMEAIMATLGGLGVRYDYLGGPNATKRNVLRALRTPYHIIHFSGHAAFDPQDPHRSALVLDDVDLSVGALTATLAEQHSVLFVVNACETARSGGGEPAESSDPLSWRDQYNIFGLARAFLENGAYLLGSRWKLPDESARRFTESFYGSLLGDGVPIGRAITQARAAVKDKAASDDFSWASYVYYGDPRVCFHAVPDDPPPAEAPALAAAPTAPAAPGAVTEAARDYESVREAEPPSPERTRKLSKLVGDVAMLAGGALASYVLAEPAEQSEGDRIVLLGALEAAPDPRHFDFVMKVLEQPRSPFEEYHALKAMAPMLPDLTDAQEHALAALIQQRIEEDPDFFGTDRFLVASQILGRIQENGAGTLTEGP